MPSSRGYIVYGAVDGEEEGEFGVAAVVLFEIGVSEFLRSALELLLVTFLYVSPYAYSIRRRIENWKK